MNKRMIVMSSSVNMFMIEAIREIFDVNKIFDSFVI